MPLRAILVLASFVALYSVSPCRAVDLSQAVVVVPDNLSGPEKKAVEMLVDEVQKRTQIRWPVANAWPKTGPAVIAVGPASSLAAFGGKFSDAMSKEPASTAAEGFRIRRMESNLAVVGNDARGVLFGVGYLLRHLHMTASRITLDDDVNVTTATPSIRCAGHQLGYRPKTNSYDAWDLAQWEQYYRDLAVFGCNAIELIPPRSDDDSSSPHFPLPPRSR